MTIEDDIESMETYELKRTLNPDDEFKIKDTFAEYIHSDYKVLDYRNAEIGEIYICNIGESNRKLYQELRCNSVWNEYFKPVDYFNLLYEKIRIVLAFEDALPPSSIIKEIDIDYDNPQKEYFITYGLKTIIEEITKPYGPQPDVIYLSFKEWKTRPLSLVLTELIFRYIKLCEHIGHEISDNSISSKPSLTSRQIALIYFYNAGSAAITRSNADKIASEHNHNKPSSGHKLHQDFCDLKKQINRSGDPGTLKRIENQITLIQSVLCYLSENRKKQAKYDLRLLEILRNKY